MLLLILQMKQNRNNHFYVTETQCIWNRSPAYSQIPIYSKPLKNVFFLWTSLNLFIPIHSVIFHACSMQYGTSWSTPHVVAHHTFHMQMMCVCHISCISCTCYQCCRASGWDYWTWWHQLSPPPSKIFCPAYLALFHNAGGGSGLAASGRRGDPSPHFSRT